MDQSNDIKRVIDLGEGVVNAERNRRAHAARQGRCEYCEGFLDDPICEFPFRHARAIYSSGVVFLIPEDLGQSAEDALRKIRDPRTGIAQQVTAATKILEEIVRVWKSPAVKPVSNNVSVAPPDGVGLESTCIEKDVTNEHR
jgi:hypothetical protein